MSSPALESPARWNGFLAKLTAKVRPEFKDTVIVPATGALVFGAETCLAEACHRKASTKGICKAHYSRWLGRGRPEMAAFLADPGAPLIGGSTLAACAVQGCRFGTARRGLCVRHHGFFERSGEKDPALWLANLPPSPCAMQPETQRRECVLSF